MQGFEYDQLKEVTTSFEVDGARKGKSPFPNCSKGMELVDRGGRGISEHGSGRATLTKTRVRELNVLSSWRRVFHFSLTRIHKVEVNGMCFVHLQNVAFTKK